MFKTLLIASLCLGMSSAIYAQSTTSNTQISSNSEKFDIESAMSIMKYFEASKLKSDQLSDFLSKYNLSPSVRSLVSSYIEQGLSYSDFTKIGEDQYAITKKIDPSVGSNVEPNTQCKQVSPGTNMCIATMNVSCTYIQNGVCQ